MSSEKIISEFKNKQFKPVYWLEGEEPYYIDEIAQYAEHHILPESEASFNLSVFYGRDVQWAELVNACKRYPMFADRQVVILKEAQFMKDIQMLENYITNPLASTVLVVCYKDKKLDGKTKFAKLVKQKCEMVSTKRMYDNQLPAWTSQMLQKHGLTASQKTILLLVDHIGNDLSRLQNEVEKLAINLNGRKSITEDDIEKYIGVSKEYNTFELQDAFAKKNYLKAIRINEYFASNPKVAPIQVTLASLYNFFSKAYMVFGVGSNDEKSIVAQIGVNPYFVKDYLQATKNYGQQGIEGILLLIHDYNLKSVGIGTPPISDSELMKELIVKAMSL